MFEILFSRKILEIDTFCFWKVICYCWASLLDLVNVDNLSLVSTQEFEEEDDDDEEEDDDEGGIEVEGEDSNEGSGNGDPSEAYDCDNTEVKTLWCLSFSLHTNRSIVCLT